MIDNEDKKQLSESPYPYNLMDFVINQYNKFVGINESDITFGITAKSFEKYLTDRLTPREHSILIARFSTHQTLAQVAKDYDVTKERIRQIELYALRKLLNYSKLREYSAVPYSEYQREHNQAQYYKSMCTELIGQLKSLINDNNEIKEIELDDTIPYVPINDMALTVRSYNCFIRNDVKTLRDIITRFKTSEDLMKIRNLGKGCFEEIVSKVHAYGCKMQWEN